VTLRFLGLLRRLGRALDVLHEEASHPLLALRKVLRRQVNVTGGHTTAWWAMVREHVDRERRDTADLDERRRIRVA
jgi:hypothetical protein